MKVVNKTKWNTMDLRKIFCRCLKKDEKAEGKLYQRKRLTVHVHARRQNRGVCSGEATYNGIWIQINIPKDMNERLIESICYVFLHELQHTRGYHHGQFSEIVLRDMAKVIAPDYTLTKTIEVKKEAPDIQQIRYDRAVINLKKAETRFKRAKTIYKKWTLKVKYYEKVFAFKGSSNHS